MSPRRAKVSLGSALLATVFTAASAQPNLRLPTPSLQTRGEYGLIAVSQSRYLPEADPMIAQSLAAADLQKRLRDEVLKRVRPLKGYTFAPESQEVAPTIVEVRVERVALAKDSLMDDAPALVLRARARLVHQDLEEGLKALAQKAADDIFLVYDVPPQS